jgi:hypothetical protein
MKRQTQKMTERSSITYTKCDVHNSSFFTTPFYMIEVEGDAVGHPLTEEQAKLIIGWFETVIFEYNETTNNWDVF